MRPVFGVLLGCLLIVTVVSHTFSASLRLRDIDTIEGVADAMRAMGFQDLRLQYGVITASFPSCEDQVAVLLATLAGGSEARVRESATSGELERIIYLGEVKANSGMLTNYRAWLLANARFIWHRRGYRAPGTTVRVLISKNCPALLKLDWARLSPYDD